MITETQVTEIAQSIFNAQSGVEAGRQSYLRTLIAATQDELNNKRGEPPAAQLKALQAVHERFYALILSAAQAFVPRTQKDRAIALHAKANFARTALSAVRNHIRAGEDVALLKADKATKATLSRPAQRVRPPTVKRMKRAAEAQGKTLIATLMGLADADKAAAIEEMQLVLGQLTSQLLSLGVVATKDAAQALSEHRPLRIGKTLFMPTETQVLRQSSRPS